MNKKELLLNIGGISQTSKMPCSSWSLSAFWCKNGSKLNLIKNSSCYGCYALTGNYIRYKEHMLKSYTKKLNAYNNNTFLISANWPCNFFRTPICFPVCLMFEETLMLTRCWDCSNLLD